MNHLVEIKPLRLPHGLPDGKDDYLHTTLKSNGELHIVKRLDVPTLSPIKEGEPQFISKVISEWNDFMIYIRSSKIEGEKSRIHMM